MPTEPKTEDEAYQDRCDAGLTPDEKILHRFIRKDLDRILITDIRGVQHGQE